MSDPLSNLLAVIAARLGHRSPDITARLYLRSNEDALRDAANVMGKP